MAEERTKNTGKKPASKLQQLASESRVAVPAFVPPKFSCLLGYFGKAVPA
jgi:hypothetical protein